MKKRNQDLIDKGIMIRTRFFSKKTELPKVGYDEIIHFYKMLLKIKKRHPNFNIEKIMKKLYPNFKLDKSF